MMGRLNHDQRQLFYSFCLEEAVPDDHLVRDIAAVLDLAWVRAELAPYYSSIYEEARDVAAQFEFTAPAIARAVRCCAAPYGKAPLGSIALSTGSYGSGACLPYTEVSPHR